MGVINYYDKYFHIIIFSGLKNVLLYTQHHILFCKEVTIEIRSTFFVLKIK